MASPFREMTRGGDDGDVDSSSTAGVGFSTSGAGRSVFMVEEGASPTAASVDGA